MIVSHQSHTILTCRGRQRLHRRGVWDAPQGHSACWVSLDQQLMEGLPSAEEEPSHRRTDQELVDGGGEKKHVNIWKHEFEPNIHQTTHILLNNKLVFFFCPKAVWAEMFGFVLRLLSFKQQQHTANYMKTEPHISNSLGHLTCGHVKKSLDSKYWMTLTCCLGFTGAFIRVKGLIETYEVQQQNKKQM